MREIKVLTLTAVIGNDSAVLEKLNISATPRPDDVLTLWLHLALIKCDKPDWMPIIELAKDRQSNSTHKVDDYYACIDSDNATISQDFFVNIIAGQGVLIDKL